MLLPSLLISIPQISLLLTIASVVLTATILEALHITSSLTSTLVGSISLACLCLVLHCLSYLITRRADTRLSQAANVVTSAIETIYEIQC